MTKAGFRGAILFAITWGIVATIPGRSNAEKGVYVAGTNNANSVPMAPVVAAWQFRHVDREPLEGDATAYGGLPVAYLFGQKQNPVIISIAQRGSERALGFTHFFMNWTGLDTAVNRGIACLEANQPDSKEMTQNQTWKPGHLLTSMVTWGYGHGMYTKNEMYVMYFDRLIRLRMPSGSMPIRKLDEQAGWLGDVSEFNNFPYIAPMSEYTKNKSKAVWLPDAYFAALWRAYMAWEADIDIISPVRKYWIHRVHGFSQTFTTAQSLTIIVQDWVPVPAGGMSPGDGSTYKRKATKERKRVRVEFYDGNILLGQKATAPYILSGVKLTTPGLHGLVAISVYDDGSRGISRPACLIVQGNMYAPTGMDPILLRQPAEGTASPVLSIAAGSRLLQSETAFDLRGRGSRLAGSAGTLKAVLVPARKR